MRIPYAKFELAEFYQFTMYDSGTFSYFLLTSWEADVANSAHV